MQGNNRDSVMAVTTEGTPNPTRLLSIHQRVIRAAVTTAMTRCEILQIPLLRVKCEDQIVLRTSIVTAWGMAKPKVHTSTEYERGMEAYDPADDWSEHISSSGKKYYYNCRTEVSQWEKPKEWLEREQRQKESSKVAVNSFPKDRDYRREAMQATASEVAPAEKPSCTTPSTSSVSLLNQSTVLASSSTSLSTVPVSPVPQSPIPPLLQDPNLLRQLLPALQATLQLNNSSVDISKINEALHCSILCSTLEPREHCTRAVIQSLECSNARAEHFSNLPAASLTVRLPTLSSRQETGSAEFLTAAVTQASLQSILHKILTAGPSAAFNVTSLISQVAQLSTQATQSSQSPMSLTSDASSPRSYVSPRISTPQTNTVPHKPLINTTPVSQPKASTTVGSKQGPSTQTVQQSTSNTDNPQGHEPTSPRNLQRQSSQRSPSPGPNHTSSTCASSTSSMSQSASARNQCTLTPSLAAYFNENLIKHVQGWPAEHAEKQASRLREESHMGSIHMAENSTELKNLRSLVRVCEIQATLREQRLVFFHFFTKACCIIYIFAVFVYFKRHLNGITFHLIKMSVQKCIFLWVPWEDQEPFNVCCNSSTLFAVPLLPLFFSVYSVHVICCFFFSFYTTYFPFWCFFYFVPLYLVFICFKVIVCSL
uniref:WW domain containing adaptor with coiled-coil n=1 Tax=Leptobrachium leishanense TaxID=445787 RepID=A0A8C5QE88_9ANUR